MHTVCRAFNMAPDLPYSWIFVLFLNPVRTKWISKSCEKPLCPSKSGFGESSCSSVVRRVKVGQQNSGMPPVVQFCWGTSRARCSHVFHLALVITINYLLCFQTWLNPGSSIRSLSSRLQISQRCAATINTGRSNKAGRLRGHRGAEPPPLHTHTHPHLTHLRGASLIDNNSNKQ